MRHSSRDFRRKSTRRCRSPRGAMLFLMVVAVIALLVCAALSIDIAYMQLTRSQLRAATDAATLAGCEELSKSQDATAARLAAKNAALQNYVAGQGLQLADREIVFGHAMLSTSGTWQFSANATPYNSLQVVGERTATSLGGSVNLFFTKTLKRGTFEPTMTAIAVQQNRDIALVVDRSGSMTTQDAGGGLSRWAALKNAVTVFLVTLDQTSQNEQFGLASYSTSSTLDIPMTTSSASISTTLAGLTPEGKTNIGSGIDQGIAILNDRARHRVGAIKTMILMTDGLQNTGLAPLPEAQSAANSNIIIHTITFSPAADQAGMQAVAAATGGQHFHADTAGDLAAIYRQIALGTPVLLIQ